MTTPTPPHSNPEEEHHPPAPDDSAAPAGTPPSTAINEDFRNVSFVLPVEMLLVAGAVALTVITAIIVSQSGHYDYITDYTTDYEVSFPVWSTIFTSIALLAAAAAVTKSWASLLNNQKSNLLPAALATANIFFASGLALSNFGVININSALG